MKIVNETNDQLRRQMFEIKEEKFGVERKITTLQTKLYKKDASIQELMVKENELTSMLNQVESNYNHINEELVSEMEEKMRESQIKKDEEEEQIKNAQKTEELSQKLIEANSSLEKSKIKEKSLEKQVKSLQLQMEELNIQLKQFKQNENGIDNDQKITEPAMLEMSFDGQEGSRLGSSYLSIMKSRKESTIHKNHKKRYEMKNCNNFQIMQSNQRTKNHRMHSLRYEDMKSIILNKPEATFINYESETARSTFQDYCYLCKQDHKMLKVLVLKENNIYVLNQNSTNKPLYEIEILNIKQIIKSTGNPFVFQINFIDKKSEEKREIIIELPNAEEFFFILSNDTFFDRNVVKRRPLNIETNSDFKNSALNIFPSCKKALIMNSWINSVFVDWRLDYIIFIDDILVSFKIPSVFHYKDYKKFRKQASFYLLESYNVIGDETKIGLKKPNTFALKIKNENRDMIFSAMQKEEKEDWIRTLS